MISRRAFSMIVPMAAISVRALRAADVDGQWEAEINSPRGPLKVRFNLKSDGESLTGTIGNEQGRDVEIQDGKISGDDLSFVQVMSRGPFEIRVNYSGKVTGDEMELTRTVERPAGAPGGGGSGPQGGARPGRGVGGAGGRRPGGARGGARQQGPGGGRRGGGFQRSITFVAKRVP